VVAVFISIAAGFTDEVRDVERDDRPSGSNGEVELLAIGCL